MSITERINIAKRKRICTNCLATSHEFRRCQRTNVCYMCKQRHHSLLHRTEAPNYSRPKSENNLVKPVTSSHPALSLEHNSRFDQNSMEKPSTSAERRSFKNFSTQIQSTTYSTVFLATTVVDIMLVMTKDILLEH